MDAVVLCRGDVGGRDAPHGAAPVEPGARRRSGPGGLIRLAAGDSRQRQSAAEELANRAVADDQPLLLQLFSDPDPMVRENCLRGLQAIGGKESLAALVKLLDDPEPNVRAAVLKQLAQNPSRQLVPQVAAYVAKEQDADLVVHAIRFLVAARGQQAVKCLMSLLAHRQWQVRAAGKHPDLMPKIVELLARSEKVRQKALPHLRSFARHKDPGARAAALRGLVEAFQKAKTSATEIARAAGVQIGPLTALHSASQGRGSSMYGYSGMYGGQTSRAMRTLMERRQSMDGEPAGDEAAGNDPAQVVFQFMASASFRLVKPGDKAQDK